MCRALILALALAAALAAGTSMGRADGLEDVDCARVPISIAGSDHEVHCNLFVSTAANSVGMNIRFLTAVDADHTGTTIVADVRCIGGYVQSANLMDLMKDVYPGPFDEWRDLGRQEGFQTAEYTGQDDSGGHADCVAFARPVTFQNGGLTRFVVGHGCSTFSRQRVWDTIRRIAAAGG